MIKLLMLGTGHGGVLDFYNTCFVIQNNEGNLLIDTGGSIEIVKKLKICDINLEDIKHIFISHNHTDHILGLIWMLKLISIKAMHNEIKEKIKIYGNDIVVDSVKGILGYTLSKKMINALDDVVNFVILNDKDKYIINGIEYEFFDIKAKGIKQFGFECKFNDKRFIFLGDETLNCELYSKVKGADYATHEAFCLDSEESIFHAYEKNHSTALSVAKTMNDLDVKNIILYHTEDTHGSDKKHLYSEEARKVFNGDVIVPCDMDVIEI